MSGFNGDGKLTRAAKMIRNGRTKTSGTAAVTPAMLRERIAIRAVLKSLSVAVNERIRRATCPLCEGRSKNTLSFNENFWRCHRCASGGDCFTLVRQIKGCGFPDAMAYIARLVGIPLQDFTPNQRRELAQQKRQNERLDLVVDELAEAERALRLQYRAEVHCLERITRQARERLSELNNESEESEACWKVLELALPQLREAIAS